MDYLSIFPERLSELMFYKDLTATKLAEILKCESSTISHYLSGLHLPTVEMAITLADYFNVTTDFLLGIENENKATDFKCCPPFGERFKFICNYYNISRYKITQKTGVAESVMRYWVQGKTQPSIINVIKIAKFLNCSVDFLLGREL
ncbi:MAG: helix-turn-helix domain-containing protein [Clostridia bacterium]|nr:helix-turn-helix domain-containing protein [Clostridia bacterium]